MSFSQEFEAVYLQELQAIESKAKTPEQKAAAGDCISRTVNKRPVVRYMTIEQIVAIIEKNH